MRDSQSGYYSAAIIDFDGNSIEAVHRPGTSSSAASEAGGPTIGLLENGSVVSKSSKASTIKAESIAPPRSEARSRAVSKAPTMIERAAPSVVSRPSQDAPPSYGTQTQTVQKADDGSKAAKTIVGTLIGAAAGAAIAYAMVKGESQSSEIENPPPQYTTEYPQIMAPPSQVSSAQSQQSAYRAIEAPPPRSTYTASAPRSTVSRSMASKNPRASTIYEGTEFFPEDHGRRASEGSIFSIPEDIPLRAIEYPPPSNASQQRSQCSPSTFISSYAADKPRGIAGSVHSASTIKASQASAQRRHSYDDRDGRSMHSHHSYRASSTHSRHSIKSVKSVAKDRDGAGSTASSTRSARQVPLPAGSTATYYSAAPSQGKSYLSAREVPLPDSVIDLDVNSHVTPDDSISQVGSHAGRSTHSKHSKSGSKASRHSSRSKFEDAVRPVDSVSQVSRASQRTAKAGGSKVASKVSSRRGSQVA